MPRWPTRFAAENLTLETNVIWRFATAGLGWQRQAAKRSVRTRRWVHLADIVLNDSCAWQRATNQVGAGASCTLLAASSKHNLVSTCFEKWTRMAGCPCFSLTLMMMMMMTFVLTVMTLCCRSRMLTTIWQSLVWLCHWPSSISARSRPSSHQQTHRILSTNIWTLWRTWCLASMLSCTKRWRKMAPSIVPRATLVSFPCASRYQPAFCKLKCRCLRCLRCLRCSKAPQMGEGTRRIG